MIRRPPRSTLLPLHDALPISLGLDRRIHARQLSFPVHAAQEPHLVEHHHRRHPRRDRKSTRLNSSHSQISYAVFCLKKKNKPVPSILSDSRCTARPPASACPH